MTDEIYYRRALIDRSDDSILTYDTDGDSLDNDLILSSDYNFLVLAVTANQYIELLSSALNGAFRYYPERYIEVIYPLIKAGKLLFCQQMIECILNDQDTQQALLDFLATNGITPSSTPIESLGDTDLTSGQGCELDNLFGASTGITNLFNDLILDFNEIINANTNSVGRVGDAIEAVPGVGILPFDDILQFVESFVEDVAQNYDASYTVQLADEIRCDIFCLAQANNCTITPKLLFEYFAEKTLVEITTVDWQDFMDFMLQNTFSGTELVYAMHTFIAGVLWFGTSILQVDVNNMQRMISAMWNDADSDWILLCDECPAEVCARWVRLNNPVPTDFTIVAQQYYTWASDVWSQTSGNNARAVIRYDAPSDMQFVSTTMSIESSVLNEAGALSTQEINIYYNNVIVASWISSPIFGANQNREHTLEYSGLVDRIDYICNVWATKPPSGGSMRIRDIEMTVDNSGYVPTGEFPCE